MLWVAPEIWLRDERGVQPVPSCVGVVHMVRDPARWALSFYDYHRQVQQPRDERWVHRYRPRCTLPYKQYQRALEPYGLTSRLLNATMEACRALVWPNRSLHEHLLRLSERDGARLSALMNVLSGPKLVEAGGDMLRAAVNALTFRAMSLAVLDWRLDDAMANLNDSMAALAHFLVGTSNHTLADELASDLVHAEQASLSRQKTSKGPKHVTSILSSDERKAALLASLESDPVLSELFAVFRRALAASPSVPLRETDSR